MWIFIFDNKNNNNVVCRLNNLVRAYEKRVRLGYFKQAYLYVIKISRLTIYQRSFVPSPSVDHMTQSYRLWSYGEKQTDIYENIYL